MIDIVIYGAGGLGKEVACLIHDINEVKRTWNLLGFLDDSPKKKEWFGYPVFEGKDYLKENKDIHVIVAIGNPRFKKRVVEKIAAHVFFPTLIHPNAQILDVESVKISLGCVITAGVILTCSISLSEHVLINLNTTVGHDTTVGSYSSIMCGVNIAGNVTIGNSNYIGSGSNILNGIMLEGEVIVGAGTLVNKSVQSNKTVVGVPAREL